MKGLILLYHRIAQLPSDPQLLAVTPARFAQHLDVLSDYGHPMSLTDMTTALRERRLPDRAIAVTFDDGYADNLECAKPLLERRGIRATVFITTSYLAGTREFWWDDLERLLLLPGGLPERLRLRVGPAVHEWRLGDAAEYSEEEYLRHSGWNVERPDNPSRRHNVYRDLCRLMRDVIGEERIAVLDELSSVAGARSTGRSTHRALSSEALGEVTKDSVFDVGAHTGTHSRLSALPVVVQRREIVESYSRLREITGGEVAGFAYPFGGRADYTRRTVALVREAGFAFACSNIPGSVRPRSDPFQLPRVLVMNWHAATFADRLREWLG